MIEMMLPMCELNVESDCSIDCSSPMSAKTASKMGRRESASAGIGQAGLGHQREEAGGLEGDGLAAGVGAGDQEDREVLGAGRRRDVGGLRAALAEPEGDRDDVAGEQRVARVAR